MSNSEILKELRCQTKMTQQEFADYFGFPYRTYVEWERGGRTVAPYLLRLVIYKLCGEKLVQDDLTDKVSDKLK